MKVLERAEGTRADVQTPREGELEDQVSLCSLKVAGRLFGIDTRGIREVIARRSIDGVPLAPDFIGGVFPYRGEVLTAVSFRALIGLEPKAGEGCVLVLDGDESEERFGLMVDSVGGVVKLERSKMSANPSTLDEPSRALFSGAYRTDDGLLVQLDPERLQPSRLAATGLFRTAERPEQAGTEQLFEGLEERRCEL